MTGVQTCALPISLSSVSTNAAKDETEDKAEDTLTLMAKIKELSDSNAKLAAQNEDLSSSNEELLAKIEELSATADATAKAIAKATAKDTKRKRLDFLGDDETLPHATRVNQMGANLKRCIHNTTDALYLLEKASSWIHEDEPETRKRRKLGVVVNQITEHVAPVSRDHFFDLLPKEIAKESRLENIRMCFDAIGDLA